MTRWLNTWTIGVALAVGVALPAAVCAASTWISLAQQSSSRLRLAHLSTGHDVKSDNLVCGGSYGTRN